MFDHDFEILDHKQHMFHFCMDFDSFLQNPNEFIHTLAQSDTIEPDLGMKSMLDSYFKKNPDSFYQLPMVSTLEDLQMTPPNQIVLLRCSLLEFSSHEMFPFRFQLNGEFHSCLLNQILPDNSTKIPISSFADRECFKAMSIRPMTQWYRKDTAFIQNQLNSKVYSLKKQEKTVLNTPFEVIVKIAFDYQNESNFDLVDFIGAFVDIESDSFNEANTFDSSLPTFIAFTFKPAIFLCKSYQLFDMVENINAARDLVFHFLDSVFEPLQARVFLMWLLTSNSSSFGRLILHFAKCSPNEAEFLCSLIDILCPLFQNISMSTDFLNKKDLKPKITQYGVDNTSSLLCSNGTMVVINETQFNEEELNTLGNRNVDLLKSIVYYDKIEAEFYGLTFNFNLTNNILTLSNEVSNFTSDLSLPLGTLSDLSEISQEHIKIVRYYLDRQRNIPFQITPEGKAFVINRMNNFQQKNKRLLNEKEKTLLFIFMVNFAKSYGDENISEKACSDAEELFVQYLNQMTIPEEQNETVERTTNEPSEDFSHFGVDQLLSHYGEYLSKMSQK